MSLKSSYLNLLENESLYYIREAISISENPVLLYSAGKDSYVLLHLIKKAFYPSKPPLKLVHIDTTWKFKEMYQFRDKIAKDNDLQLIVFQNEEGIKNNINPFDNPKIHSDVWKTEGLKKAINKYNFDIIFGGGRRDEEKSRSKERIFSFRNSNQNWDPKLQRPEILDLFNTLKFNNESIRVFPLSNWTELDIWLYILYEKIEVVPLYFSKIRPVIENNGLLIMKDDDRLRLKNNQIVQNLEIRFRTLGCYPLTGAIQSKAKNVEEIIEEMLSSKTSERQGRVIDKDEKFSMEKKKISGYF